MIAIIEGVLGGLVFCVLAQRTTTEPISIQSDAVPQTHQSER